MSDETESSKKITTKLEEVPPWASELTVFVKSGFADLHERLDTMATNVDIQGDTVRDVAKRMTALEERQNTADARLGSHSERAKASAITDDKHDAAIAMLHAKLDDNTSKTDRALAILERLDRVAANPMVRRVFYAIGAAILAYIAAKTKGLL